MPRGRGIPMSELIPCEECVACNVCGPRFRATYGCYNVQERVKAARPAAPVDVEKGTALASAALVEGVECRYHSFPGKQALCPIQRGPCLRKPCMITKGEG